MINSFLYKNGVHCIQLALFGCSDLNGTNCYEFYGGFEKGLTTERACLSLAL